MTAGRVQLSDISSLMNVIYDDALLVARDNNLMSALVASPNDATNNEAETRKLYEYTGATINTIGEDDDLASQTFTPAVLNTLTPAEVGAQYFITDKRMNSDYFAVRSDAAQDLGLAMATKIETDLLGDFSSLTGGTIGSSGTTLTWGHLYAAANILRAQKAPLPYACVLHPYQYHPLGKAVVPAGNSNYAATAPRTGGGQILQNYFVQGTPEFEIYITSNITAGAASVGAMFSRKSLILDPRRAIRLEPERDASRRGWELNMTAVYAHGVWRKAWGVQIIATSASAPTE